MRRTFSHLRTSVAFAALCAGAASVAACSGNPYDDYYQYDVPTDDITVTQEPPPAISGGTMMVARDGRTVIAADPDRDRVWIVDLETSDVASVPLEHGDEPGRVVEDGSGRAHVALRRGGAVVTIDVGARELIERRDVCPAPRGLAYDASADTVHVACSGGELVTLPAAGGAPVRTLRLARDLRDIVVEGDRLLVSRFRSAETLVVDADGTVLARRELPAFTADSGTGSVYQPTVAWRMVGLPGGGAAMVHQRSMLSQVVLTPGGYYSTSGCDGNIVHGAISLIDPAGDDTSEPLPPVAAIPAVALPVDIAVSADGTQAAIVAAGNDLIVQTRLSAIVTEAGSGSCFPSISSSDPSVGQPIAVAFDGQDRVIVQTREPASIRILNGAIIDLPADSMRDTGHEMFHRSPSGFNSIACASCHPEGHEDGHTWNFDPAGLRRTQDIGGGILQTAPFHWSGDQADLTHLMNEVFVSRMSGPKPGARRIKLVGRFLDNLPAHPASPPADAAAVSRGEALFNDAKVACASCHSGPMLTNNETKDVGTGEPLQVPALVGLAGRAPFMHNGCAATLRDRFDPTCGGASHGDVSGLSASQLDDLVAYLESL